MRIYICPDPEADQEAEDLAVVPAAAVALATAEDSVVEATVDTDGIIITIIVFSSLVSADHSLDIADLIMDTVVDALAV